jgi:predicted nuclease of predicted toxin-antitoxin system
VKVLLDMNLSPAWVPFLERAGIEAVHWSSVGDARAPVLVFTNDLDFSALLALTRSMGPSVLQVRLPDLLPSAIGGIVTTVLRHHETSFREGAIVTVSSSGTRVRILPLRPLPA